MLKSDVVAAAVIVLGAAPATPQNYTNPTNAAWCAGALADAGKNDKPR